MSKKRLMGILVFSLILVSYLSYPNFREWNFQSKVNAMVKAEEYQRINDLLSKRELDPSSKQFFSLLKAKIELQDDAREMIEKLVENQEREALQKLVDEYGIKLDYYLIFIDKVEGIAYSQEVREYLALWYVESGNIQRAMELRGDSDKVDLVFLAYLSKQNSLKELLEIYHLVPEYLLPLYYNIINHDFIYVGIINNPENVASFLDSLTEHDFPEGVLMAIGREFFNNMQYTLELELNEHPFFSENIYYDLFLTHSKLSNAKEREKALQALKSDKFDGIQGRDRLVDLAQNATHTHNFFSVTSEGKFKYSVRVDDENPFINDLFKNYLYDIKTGSKKEVDFNHLYYQVSPNRIYIAVTDFTDVGSQLKVFEQSFNIKLSKKTDHYFPEFWVNNLELVLRDDVRNRRQVLNINTGEIREYAGEKPYTDGFEPVGKGFRLWSINEERYVGIDIQNDQFHYVVRDRKNHQEITRIPLEYGFIGSCDEYVYGIKTEEGFINVLVKQNIATREIQVLPFYTVKNYTGYPVFIKLN